VPAAASVHGEHVKLHFDFVGVKRPKAVAGCTNCNAGTIRDVT
jgi:hypothetical protein